MDSGLIPGGPIDVFLKLTGKTKAEYEKELAGWNQGAIALFLAEFHYEEEHDVAVNEAVDFLK
jgi:hypothetical protein